jgi:hypothetical protein
VVGHDTGDDDDQGDVRPEQEQRREVDDERGVVAFEVDDIDPLEHTGWSVVVTGVARPVVDPDDIASLTEMGIARWAAGLDGHVVEVSLDLVSGRRIPPGLPPG